MAITAHAVRLQRAGRIVLTNAGPGPAIDLHVDVRTPRAGRLPVLDRQPIGQLSPGESRDLTVEGDAPGPWELSLTWFEPGVGHRGARVQAEAVQVRTA